MGIPVSRFSYGNPMGMGMDNCDNYRVSGALEKLEHETNLQDRVCKLEASKVEIFRLKLQTVKAEIFELET